MILLNPWIISVSSWEPSWNLVCRQSCYLQIGAVLFLLVQCVFIFFSFLRPSTGYMGRAWWTQQWVTPHPAPSTEHILDFTPELWRWHSSSLEFRKILFFFFYPKWQQTGVLSSIFSVWYLFILNMMGCTDFQVSTEPCTSGTDPVWSGTLPAPHITKYFVSLFMKALVSSSLLWASYFDSFI